MKLTDDVLAELLNEVNRVEGISAASGGRYAPMAEVEPTTVSALVREVQKRRTEALMIATLLDELAKLAPPDVATLARQVASKMRQSREATL